MTTKKMTTIVLAAVLTLGFVACNKEEAAPVDRTVKSVTIRIANANTEAGTRAIEAPVTETTKNTVKNATLFFLNGVSKASIVEYVQTVPEGEITKMLAEASGNKGYKIEGVPNSAKAVTVVLNAPATVTGIGVGKNHQNILDAVLTVNDMNVKVDANTTGSITMTGDPETLMPDATGANFGPGAQKADFYASVTVAPVVARVEVLKVEAKTGSEIKSFTVEGVFVKKFHQKTTLGKVGSESINYSNKATTDGLTLNADYYKQADGTYAGNNKNMRNLLADLGLDATTKVAGFQVAAGETPWIVLKVKDIKLNDGTDYNPDKDNYVVISGYKDAGTAVVQFESNKVYKLNLTGENGIDVNNITDDVDAKKKTVWVGVTITPWTVKNVTPVYN